MDDQHVVAHLRERSSDFIVRDLHQAPEIVRSALVNDDNDSLPNLRAKLKGEVLPASWPELLYQFARGALFLVTPEVDLLDVGEAMANDDRSQIERYLRAGQLRRATDDDARTFQASPGLRLQFLIVQPWVVAQAL